MENTNSLKAVNDRGWRMGFANLFHEATAASGTPKMVDPDCSMV
jgi:hypothetical protein